MVMTARPSGRPRPFVLIIMDVWGSGGSTRRPDGELGSGPSKYWCGEARLARLYSCQRVDCRRQLLPEPGAAESYRACQEELIPIAYLWSPWQWRSARARVPPGSTAAAGTDP